MNLPVKLWKVLCTYSIDSYNETSERTDPWNGEIAVYVDGRSDPLPKKVPLGLFIAQTTARTLFQTLKERAEEDYHEGIIVGYLHLFVEKSA